MSKRPLALTSIALLAATLAAPSAWADGTTWHALVPSGGCAPASPASSDRLITCAGGLSTTAPSATTASELQLNTTTTDLARRTATFEFSSDPLASPQAVDAGTVQAQVFAGVSGGGSSLRAPIDLRVDLVKHPASGPDVVLGQGTSAGQTLRSTVQSFLVPYTISGDSTARTLGIGDRLVFRVTAVNQTGGNFKIVLALGATSADTNTGAIARACVTGLTPDADADGVPDYCDNCAGVANPDQADADANGLGDACSCTADLPGVCVPGNGSSRTDCAAELLPVNAYLTPSRSTGIPTPNVACMDGDPSCDADGAANGVCHLRTVMCLTNTDPRLPACGPQALDALEVKKPKSTGGDAADAANLTAIQQAAQSLGLAIRSKNVTITPGPGSSAPNACTTTPFELAVPLVQSGSGARKGRKSFSLKFSDLDSDGRIAATDTDKLVVDCLTPGSVSTTTSPTTSTTSTTGGATTTTTQPPPSLDFISVQGAGVCGAAKNASQLIVRNLDCGKLYLGNGAATVAPNDTPPGATNRFSLNCTGTVCQIGPTGQSIVSPVLDCSDTGCNFGTPLPLSAAATSSCVINTFSAPVAGTIDLTTGAPTNFNFQLSSRTYLTGNPEEPCPRCIGFAGSPSPETPQTGTCNRGVRSGQSCITTNVNGLSKDCLPKVGEVAKPGASPTSDLGAIPISLSPLTTGPQSADADAGGRFCPGQGTTGCFTNTTCRRIEESGSPAGTLLPGGTKVPVSLASIFCAPSTSSPLVNFAAGLPGPGATNIAGQFRYNP